MAFLTREALQEAQAVRDEDLGPTRAACLVELEFIDRPEVDTLLNIGPDSLHVRQDIARAIAHALISRL